MRAISENEAIAYVKEKLSPLSSYDVIVFKREPIEAAMYELQIAIRANADEVTQELITALIQLDVREDKPIKFGGTEVDTKEDLKATYIFMNATILAQV